MATKELIIMRHAKSDWHSENISDFDRPLNKRGLLDVPRMAEWMASQNIAPDLLISSPALRARQTTSEVASRLQIDDSSIIYDKRMYLAGVDTLLAIIGEIDNTHTTVMLVGHNPGLETLATGLSRDQLPAAPDGGLMTTANVIQLRTQEAWDALTPHGSEFLQLMRPKQLP